MSALYHISSFYKFTTIDDIARVRQELFPHMERLSIKGTILLAKEGINATIAGKEEPLSLFVSIIEANAQVGEVNQKKTTSEKKPFRRAKIKLKKEIITMGVPDLDVLALSGKKLNSSEWNELLKEKEVFVIDTRNHYEVAVGSFSNASNPKLSSFRELPQYIDPLLPKLKNKKVAMFCTGGIRCEKSTAYLKEKGVNEVYHLSGGILEYLENTPEEESLWQGECFVFDDRVTVNTELKNGSYEQCHACRMPLSKKDRSSSLYQPGVMCPHCHDKVSELDRDRFREREKQINLAKKRGYSHL